MRLTSNQLTVMERIRAGTLERYGCNGHYTIGQDNTLRSLRGRQLVDYLNGSWVLSPTGIEVLNAELDRIWKRERKNIVEMLNLGLDVQR